jgi:hypothetical protein
MIQTLKARQTQSKVVNLSLPLVRHHLIWSLEIRHPTLTAAGLCRAWRRNAVINPTAPMLIAQPPPSLLAVCPFALRSSRSAISIAMRFFIAVATGLLAAVRLHSYKLTRCY